jgi:membrane-bound lytic murein transglycosylase
MRSRTNLAAVVVSGSLSILLLGCGDGTANSAATTTTATPVPCWQEQFTDHYPDATGNPSAVAALRAKAAESRQKADEMASRSNDTAPSSERSVAQAKAQRYRAIENKQPSSKGDVATVTDDEKNPTIEVDIQDLGSNRWVVSHERWVVSTAVCEEAPPKQTPTTTEADARP